MSINTPKGVQACKISPASRLGIGSKLIVVPVTVYVDCEQSPLSPRDKEAAKLHAHSRDSRTAVLRVSRDTCLAHYLIFRRNEVFPRSRVNNQGIRNKSRCNSGSYILCPFTTKYNNHRIWLFYVKAVFFVSVIIALVSKEPRIKIRISYHTN